MRALAVVALDVVGVLVVVEVGAGVVLVTVVGVFVVLVVPTVVDGAVELDVVLIWAIVVVGEDTNTDPRTSSVTTSLKILKFLVVRKPPQSIRLQR